MSVAPIEATGRFMQSAERLPTLFALEDQAYRLLVAIEGTEDPDDISAAERQLALVDEMLMHKTESYVSVIRSLESMAVARKAEADRLKARAQTAEAHADWLKARLLTHMKVTEQERIETSRFTLSIRQNAPSCVVIEEMMVPPEFKRTVVTTTVDKLAIKAHVKATGEVVPGIELVRTESLSIR